MRNVSIVAATVMATVALASCGQSSDDRPSAEQPAAQTTPASAPQAAAAGDPCTLVADTQAMFGKPVTASKKTMPDKTTSCEWQDAETRMCGLVTVFGPGWNEVPDLPANYTAMVTSLGMFGQTRDVAGLGEEAKAVDGGITGAQVAFRTGKALALVASNCSAGALDKNALAEKLARGVAERL
jgi:hypothetical protein